MCFCVCLPLIKLGKQGSGQRLKTSFRVGLLQYIYTYVQKHMKWVLCWPSHAMNRCRFNFRIGWGASPRICPHRCSRPLPLSFALSSLTLYALQQLRSWSPIGNGGSVLVGLVCGHLQRCRHCVSSAKINLPIGSRLPLAVFQCHIMTSFSISNSKQRSPNAAQWSVKQSENINKLWVAIKKRRREGSCWHKAELHLRIENADVDPSPWPSANWTWSPCLHTSIPLPMLPGARFTVHSASFSCATTVTVLYPHAGTYTINNSPQLQLKLLWWTRSWHATYVWPRTENSSLIYSSAQLKNWVIQLCYNVINVIKII